MKNTSTILILLILLVSCHKEETAKPAPASLIGNWKTIPNGQPRLRWTFDLTNAYQTWDWSDSSSCQPVTPRTSVAINKYTVRNDTLIFEYKDQFFFSFYVYHPIKTLTQDRLVIARPMAKAQDSIFERCP